MSNENACFLVDEGIKKRVASPIVGTEATRQAVIEYLTAFSDMDTVNKDVFAEGDTVVIRWLSTGTHTGAFMGSAGQV